MNPAVFGGFREEIFYSICVAARKAMKAYKTGWVKSPKNALLTQYSPDGNISTFKGLWYQH